MIIVNGKEINLTEDTTVAEYLEQNQYQVKRIAVELNGDILPKYSYSWEEANIHGRNRIRKYDGEYRERKST